MYDACIRTSNGSSVHNLGVRCFFFFVRFITINLYVKFVRGSKIKKKNYIRVYSMLNVSKRTFILLVFYRVQTKCIITSMYAVKYEFLCY